MSSRHRRVRSASRMRHQPTWVVGVAVLLTLTAAGTAQAAPNPAPSPSGAPVAPEVRVAAATGGRTPVIVTYRDDAPAPAATASGDVVRHAALGATADRVLGTLDAGSYDHAERVANWPMVAVDADPDAIDRLAASPDVVAISPNRPHRAALAQSVPEIGGPVAYADGITGAGQTVAIVDTGVDASHPFLGGRVVAEACFSSDGNGATAICPGADPTTASGPGAAAPCPMVDCYHGTHVAGIAAGDNGTFNGVAKAADIIAVQVFSRYQAPNCAGPSACAMYTDFDLVRGLDFVFGLRSTYDIAAANMSLGGFFSPGPCDYSPEEAPFSALRGAGIAPVVAAGNDGMKDALSLPACASNAISVGATTKGTPTVAGFSNSDPFLTLLAPGVNINSSLPNSTYGLLSGTSMATPHVTGAFALVKQQHPSWTVDDIASLLRSTGLDVTDTNGLTVPRIRLDGATRPPTFHPVAGTRLLDTRDTHTPLGAGATLKVPVPTGTGVPSTASGVMVNVTGIAPSLDTHLTLAAAGYPPPITSNINLPAGDTRAAASIVALGDSHAFTIFNNSGATNVAVDIVGWVDDGGVDDTGARFVPTAPTRLLDTRTGTGGVPTAKIGAGESIEFPVGASCPAGSTAAALNVTMTDQTLPTHFTVYPAGPVQVGFSNLNAPVGSTRANLATTLLGTDGKVAIRNNAGSADAVVDLYGCYTTTPPSTTSGRVVPVDPVRIVDTRVGLGAARPGKLSGDGIQANAFQVAGRGGVPSRDVKAVLVNITATNNDTDTHITVSPTGVTLEQAIAALGSSVLNLSAGETAANLVEVALGPDGKFLAKTNAGATDLVVDVVGWVEA